MSLVVWMFAQSGGRTPGRVRQGLCSVKTEWRGPFAWIDRHWEGLKSPRLASGWRQVVAKVRREVRTRVFRSNLPNNSGDRHRCPFKPTQLIGSRENWVKSVVVRTRKILPGWLDKWDHRSSDWRWTPGHGVEEDLCRWSPLWLF